MLSSNRNEARRQLFGLAQIELKFPFYEGVPRPNPRNVQKSPVLAFFCRGLPVLQITNLW